MGDNCSWCYALIINCSNDLSRLLVAFRDQRREGCSLKAKRFIEVTKYEVKCTPKNEQYEACPRKYLVSLLKHVLNKYSSLLCESLFALNRMPSREETFVFHLGFPLQHSPREISCRSCFKKEVKPDFEPSRIGIPTESSVLSHR